MKKSTISEVMRYLALQRHANENKEQLKEIVSKAGRASWDALTQEQRQARIDKIQAALAKKRAARAKHQASAPRETAVVPSKPARHSRRRTPTT